jgi:thymidylate synthase ThyX
MWREALGSAEQYYSWLIEQGVPAEDARGLLPHAVTTRLHWVLDLRGLLHVAGLRLCTQAQFEWRLVMAQVVKALRKYRHDHVAADDAWQFNRIADALRPVCYQEGRCGFMAQFDRGCTIRERVEANAAIGRPSSKWSETLDVFHVDREQRTIIKAIQPSEWAADPTAARRPT